MMSTSQLSLALTAPTRWGMARLSCPGWLRCTSTQFSISGTKQDQQRAPTLIKTSALMLMYSSKGLRHISKNLSLNTSDNTLSWQLPSWVSYSQAVKRTNFIGSAVSPPPPEHIQYTVVHKTTGHCIISDKFVKCKPIFTIFAPLIFNKTHLIFPTSP